MKENDTNIKVPFISKLAYGMGDVGCNFSWMFVGNFLMIFYTDVFGISMSAVAALMLFSRFWDAINDPIVGGLTDRTNTRWGRYRPWLLIAAFLGKAGDDMHGHFLKDTLMSCNIDCTGFSLSKNYFTTLAFVDVKTNGEREFSFARNHGADKMLAVEEIPEDIITQSKILHIGSISLTDEPCRSATVYAVNTARQNGVIVSYDPNFRASLWKDKNEAINTMRSMIQYVDLMKISEEETELLTGKADYTEAADILIGQGVKIVAVTLGKKGAFVRTEKGGILVKGFFCTAFHFCFRVKLHCC